MILSIGCVSSLLSIIAIKNFKRKTLLISGHLLTGIMFILISFLLNNLVESPLNNAILGILYSFSIVYQVTCGVVVWIYMVETLSDSGLSITMFAYYLVAIGVNLIAINKTLIADTFDYDLFYIFGGLALILSIYVYKLMKETKGLNEQ